MNQAELLQKRVDEPGVAQQKHPGVGSDQEAGPEGKNHQAQIEILALAGPGDKQRERKSEQQAENCGRARDPERAPHNSKINGINQPLVAFERPGLRNSAPSSASQQAVCEDDGERRREQGQHHGPGGCQEPGPEPVHFAVCLSLAKVSSSSGCHHTSTASPSLKLSPSRDTSATTVWPSFMRAST